MDHWRRIFREAEDGVGRAIGRLPPGTPQELRRFSEILAASAEAAEQGCRGAGRELEAALVSLGFQAKPEVVAFLASLVIGQMAPLHIKAARRISAEPATLLRLAGLRISEFQLELMGFEHLAPRLARPFFLSSRQGFADEERAWTAGLHVDSAVRLGVQMPRLITSEAALIGEGQRASSVLRAAGLDQLGSPFLLEN